jgi:hypothetical protein
MMSRCSGGHPVPERVAEQHDVLHHAVLGHHHVLLHLVEFHRRDGVERIFLPVDQAGLQRGVELGEVDRDRGRARRQRTARSGSWNPSRGISVP